MGSREGQSGRPLSSQPTPFSAGFAGRDRGKGSGTGQEELDQRTWKGRAGPSVRLTNNHGVVPAVVMAEVEVAARGRVASGHQAGVQHASLQDPHCPHSQEAQHEQQEQPQTPKLLPAA